MLPLLQQGKVVEWHRVRAYQDVSLKLILQEVLQELALERSNDRVYLRRDVSREPLHPMPSLPTADFHLFVSHHNVGVSTFMKLLSMYRSSGTIHMHSSTRNYSFWARHSRSIPMKITSDPKQMTRALHFLCYLNAATHTSGRLTAKFHAELERALQAGMHILLVHET